MTGIPVVYMAGPIWAKSSDERFANIMKAHGIAIRLWKAGIPTICPHLNTMDFDKLPFDKIPEEHFYAGDLEILSRCDAVLLLPGWQRSHGANLEAEHAGYLHIPLFFSVDVLLAEFSDVGSRLLAHYSKAYRLSRPSGNLSEAPSTSPEPLPVSPDQTHSQLQPEHTGEHPTRLTLDQWSQAVFRQGPRDQESAGLESPSETPTESVPPSEGSNEH